MKLIISFIFGLLFLSSCKEKPNEFDLNKTTYLYKYSYEHDRKKSVYETIYYLAYGKIQDSTRIETTFEYNDKGLLIRETSNNTSDRDNPSYRLYNYNSKDSLELQLSISSTGDTIFREEYKYFQGVRKPIYHRTILVYFDYNLN